QPRLFSTLIMSRTCMQLPCEVSCSSCTRYVLDKIGHPKSLGDRQHQALLPTVLCGLVFRPIRENGSESRNINNRCNCGVLRKLLKLSFDLMSFACKPRKPISSLSPVFFFVYYSVGKPSFHRSPD